MVSTGRYFVTTVTFVASWNQLASQWHCFGEQVQNVESAMTLAHALPGSSSFSKYGCFMVVNPQRW
eukprot:6473500-Amphidinium_carterae.1